MNRQYKFDLQHTADKRHIIITGDRGSGKTTLLNLVIDKLDVNSQVPQIITRAIPKEAVYMSKKGSCDKILIGLFDPDSVHKENRMKVVEDGFNIQGVQLIDELINCDSEWVAIDEIGYLESSCSYYMERLYTLFDKKKVIAVVRKQNIDYLNELSSRKDALIIDLDK